MCSTIPLWATVDHTGKIRKRWNLRVNVDFEQ